MAYPPMNPWEQQAKPLSKEEEMMAAMGIQALKSGKVSVEDAKKNAAELGMDPTLGPQARINEQAQAALQSGSLRPQGTLNMVEDPGPPQMGTKRSAQQDIDQKSMSNIQRILRMTPEEYQEGLHTAMGIMPARGTPGEEGYIPESIDQENPYQIQKAGADRLEKLLDMTAQQPQQIDFSPIMALVDSLYGTKLQAGYTKPETTAARRDKILAYADDIQKRKGEMAKYLDQAVRSQKAGTQTDLLQTLMTEKYLKEAGFQPHAPRTGSPTNTPWRAMEADFLKPGIAGKYIEQLRSIPVALAQADINNTTAIEMLKRSLLNIGGDTRPSDRDVAAFGGDARLLEKAKQLWDSKFETGTLTGLNQSQVRALLQGMSRVASKRFTDIIKGTARNANRKFPTLNASPEQVEEHLYNATGWDPADIAAARKGGEYQYVEGARPKSQVPLPGQNSTPEGGMLSPQEWKARKDAAKKGK